jgi:hypothetical protein
MLKNHDFWPFWIIFSSKTVHENRFLTFLIDSLHAFLHYLCSEDVAEKLSYNFATVSSENLMALFSTGYLNIVAD